MRIRRSRHLLKVRKAQIQLRGINNAGSRFSNHIRADHLPLRICRCCLGGGYKIIKELRKPSDDLRDKVEKHERLLDNDNKRIHKIEESNQLILRCMLDLINHAITGNGIEKMKETRDVLQDFLIDN